MVSSPTDIQHEAWSYFSNIYKASIAFDASKTFQTLENINLPMLQNVHLSIFSDSITQDEIDNAVFEIKSDSAPGPDGFHARFFQYYWNVLRNDISAMIVQCFSTGYLLKELNKTFIVLIPKCNKPNTFKDFRPISLCNVIYKLLSKVLCNRLKRVLPDLITPNQNAFLKGRLITDNILLASECMEKIKKTRKNKIGLCAFKVDIAKAYDKVSWSFLEMVEENEFPCILD